MEIRVRPLVEQSLSLGHRVRVIVRSRHRLPAAVLEPPNIAVIEASILELSDQQLSDAAKGCDAVVSCLGRVMNFKGIFGAPKKLCTDATRR
jgi:nucleoside-diphosphate-sugar epimerase